VIPVHIGEAESNALLKELNKQRQSRPLTHDLAKNMVQAVGYRVTKVRCSEPRLIDWSGCLGLR